ncbi:conserved hypothetical protein [Talaromyces stipitatus ATCC 10500]|uniref:Zn(2)-C6 fungal-type domain-containing protein n=1 Tax=Talaromyces stipitatus (strain ATCC 10500 / CBS 375.48 / QM 6759 / NRRL 1006) TaxID=441959 RepID=B8MM70_TALSN|nr:uncharacterized protein TSTA_098390 [Talaromyces stipitatus ATCC 10500]EED13582.1 conserved hypothetical protein [Talaromyces stipitatus ATCC 10500]
MPAMIDTNLRVTRRRRRSARSCNECRRRKVKCDRQVPCSRCLTTRKHCVYNNEVLSGVSSGNTIPTSYTVHIAGPQVTPQSTVEPALAPSRDDSRAEADGVDTISIPRYTHQNMTPGANALPKDISSVSRRHDDHINELETRLRTLEHLLSRNRSSLDVDRTSNSGPSTIRESEYASNSVLHGTKTTLNKSRLFGRTHWTNDVYEVHILTSQRSRAQFKRINDYMKIETPEPSDNERIKSLKSEIHMLLQKCKLLAKGIKTFRPTRCLSLSEPALPTKVFADAMAHLYMSRFESAFRILHIPSFWAEYDNYWRHPATAPDVTKYKVHLVISIGCSLCQEPYGSDQVYSAACQWVYASQAWLSAPMEKDRIGISGLQVQCLLILARQCLSVSGDLIWVSMGTLLRTAMQMGLHRDPSHLANMSVLDTEIRRRLWATIMEMNVQASLDAGMQPIVSLQDFDTKPPSNINDTDIDDRTEEIFPRPHATSTDTSLQIFLSECLQPRFDILHIMNGVNSEMTQEEAITLTSEIIKSCNHCRDLIRHGPGNEGKVFRHNFADLLIRRFLLSLHRPWASRAHVSPLFYYSRKISYDSASTLLSPPKDENFTRLLLRGSGMFKNRIIHVSLALASELLIEIQEKGSNPVAQPPWDYRAILVAAVQEAQWQSAQRMKFGETNVRLHMKLSVVLSQAESLLPGQSLQERMIESAKDSLEISYATIQAHLGLPQSPVYSGGTMNLEGNQMTFSPLLDIDDILQATEFALDGGHGSSSSIF